MVPPTASHPSPAVIAFPGGQLEGASGETITWPGGARRAYAPPQVAAQLRAAVQEGRPLAVELARYLGRPEALALCDPAFEAYRGAGLMQVGAHAVGGGIEHCAAKKLMRRTAVLPAASRLAEVQPA